MIIIILISILINWLLPIIIKKSFFPSQLKSIKKKHSGQCQCIQFLIQNFKIWHFLFEIFSLTNTIQSFLPAWHYGVLAICTFWMNSWSLAHLLSTFKRIAISIKKNVVQVISSYTLIIFFTDIKLTEDLIQKSCGTPWHTVWEPQNLLIMSLFLIPHC